MAGSIMIGDEESELLAVSVDFGCWVLRSWESWRGDLLRPGRIPRLDRVRLELGLGEPFARNAC